MIVSDCVGPCWPLRLHAAAVVLTHTCTLAQWPAACRCGPCVLLAKELETVAEKLGEGVRILKIDTDANPDISTQLQGGCLLLAGGRVGIGGCEGQW